MDCSEGNSVKSPMWWDEDGEEHPVSWGDDVLQKLKSEVEAQEEASRAEFHWYCCQCGTGPMNLQVPAGIDESNDFDAEENCIGHDCSHPRCEKYCMVLPVGNGNIQNKKSPAAVEVDGLILSEQRLSIFKDIPEQYNFQAALDNRPGYILGLSLDETLRSPSPATPGLTISSVSSPNLGGDEGDEPPMNQETMIGLKKSECLLNLAHTWYKRWKKENTKGTLNKPPQDSLISKLTDPEDFVFVWQQAVLPFLAEFVPLWCGPNYTIGLRRGESPSSRFINIMTDGPLPETEKETIRYHVFDLLPPVFHTATSLSFETGSLERLASSTSTAESQLDDICYPKNTYYYQRPTITSTLGPCIAIEDASYWLINLHPFEKALKSQAESFELPLVHPSPDDQMICDHARHNFTSICGPDFTIGNIMATSINSTRSRKSNASYWEEAFMDPPEIIMDWGLCKASTRITNFLRSPTFQNYRKEESVLTTMQPQGGAPARSAGRTSGYQSGHIGLCPDLVSKKITGSVHDTMEWFVEEAYPYDDEARFTDSGIGVSGDSGAAIVDQASNALIGQVWGRNKYRKRERGPRIAYFTPVHDIFDDMQELCAPSEHPRLPQFDHGSSLPSSRPACEHCSNLQSAKQEREAFPELAFEEMTPAEDEILTPEEIRSPDVRKQLRLEFCHVGLSSSMPLDMEETASPDPCSPRESFLAKEFDFDKELDFDSESSIDLDAIECAVTDRKRVAAWSELTPENKKQRVV
ncbi:hypothetical protein LSUE1_G001715 [Lachnellula suecica]|uniref:Uncharacterized protein n=1 Tax=Lachnellula suecica TaxID=602035 RepID=A0A8T9CEF9_9HELO|nr:hypothetical protein LSUE1_G001715 [Lachnellula suecica]